MFWSWCRSFIVDVWSEITGRPTLKSVMVVTGSSGGFINYTSVGFKLGLFGRPCADMPTLLQFEPKYRAQLEKLGWKL